MDTKTYDRVDSHTNIKIIIGSSCNDVLAKIVTVWYVFIHLLIKDFYVEEITHITRKNLAFTSNQ